MEEHNYIKMNYLIKRKIFKTDNKFILAQSGSAKAL